MSSVEVACDTESLISKLNIDILTLNEELKSSQLERASLETEIVQEKEKVSKLDQDLE